MAEERRQQLVDVRAVERVIVVEHEHRVLGQVRDFRRQRGGQVSGRREHGQAQQQQRVPSEVGSKRLQRRDEGKGKGNHVGVVFVQREVGGGARRFPQPGGEQRRLAVAGRRG